jgi:transcriptional regulator with XRE-family HTH domain
MKHRLANVIYQNRTKQGLKRKQLAELSGVKVDTIAGIEKGSANPRFVTVIRLLKALKCGSSTLNYIFEKDYPETITTYSVNK